MKWIQYCQTERFEEHKVRGDDIAILGVEMKIELPYKLRSISRSVSDSFLIGRKWKTRNHSIKRLNQSS